MCFNANLDVFVVTLGREQKKDVLERKDCRVWVSLRKWTPNTA